MIEKQYLLNKLTLLTQLVVDSTPVDSIELFDSHLIEIEEMHALVNIIHKVPPVQIIELMKRANIIWKVRNKFKNNNYLSIHYRKLHEEIEDLITQRERVEAIKLYRNSMKSILNEDVSLKDAKKYVDSIEIDLKNRKILI